MSITQSKKASRNQVLVRMIVGAGFVTALIAAATAWQSWSRNTGLEQLTSLPIYLGAIWSSYLLWIGIAFLIFRWQRKTPMFSTHQPYWWLVHISLSALVGVVHLLIDTTILWLALSQNFSLSSGFIEKLLRWMPYEMLAYWACLFIITLIENRTKLLQQDQPDYLTRLTYKVADETQVIPVDKIDYIEAFDNFVKVRTDGEREVIKLTMSSLERRLDPKKFVRIHRSYIVNLNSVVRLKKSDNRSWVVLSDASELPISRRKRKKLIKTLG